MRKRAFIVQKLAKILKSLDPGEEWNVCQLILLTWCGPPASVNKARRRARKFAKRYGCMLLFPEWSREPATFFKLERS
jgi:hypothetical protein